MELFLDRFELETEAEHFSPAVKALFEAYDELLTLYERQDGKTLLQANRVAAVEALEEEPAEFRRRAGVFGHPPQPAAAAAPDPGGPNGPRGHNSRQSRPDVPARGGDVGRAEGPGGVSDAPALGGRGAAAPGRAPGPEVCKGDDPLSTHDPWKGRGGKGAAGLATCEREAVERRRSPRPARRPRRFSTC